MSRGYCKWHYRQADHYYSLTESVRTLYPEDVIRLMAHMHDKTLQQLPLLSTMKKTTQQTFYYLQLLLPPIAVS